MSRKKFAPATRFALAPSKATQKVSSCNRVRLRKRVEIMNAPGIAVAPKRLSAFDQGPQRNDPTKRLKKGTLALATSKDLINVTLVYSIC